MELDQNSRVAVAVMAKAAEYIAEQQSVLGIQLRSTTLSAADRADAIERTLADSTSAISVLMLPPESVETAVTTKAEEIRVSAWISAAGRSALTYVAGWPTELTNSLQGLQTAIVQGDPASDVFLIGEPVHYRDLPDGQRPPRGVRRLYTSPVGFRGILIVPIYGAGPIIGVLQIEREKADRFEPAQVALARSLAALYAAALS